MPQAIIALAEIHSQPARDLLLGPGRSQGPGKLPGLPVSPPLGRSHSGVPGAPPLCHQRATKPGPQPIEERKQGDRAPGHRVVNRPPRFRQEDNLSHPQPRGPNPASLNRYEEGSEPPDQGLRPEPKLLATPPIKPGGFPNRDLPQGSPHGSRRKGRQGREVRQSPQGGQPRPILTGLVGPKP